MFLGASAFPPVNGCLAQELRAETGRTETVVDQAAPGQFLPFGVAANISDENEPRPAEAVFVKIAAFESGR